MRNETGLQEKMHKRRKGDVNALKELVRTGAALPLVHVKGPVNPADPLTKPKGRTGKTQVELRDMIAGRWRGVELESEG